MEIQANVCNFLLLIDPDANICNRIALTGSSEYQINGKTCTYQNYNAALEKHNILVKAKNFLVFQGDVEAVASQSPLALTKLIEQISGSLELATEYDEAQKNQERATENATFNYTKRRGINGEIKQFKEQKTEAQRFEKLVEQRVIYHSLNTPRCCLTTQRTSKSSTSTYGSCITSRRVLRSTLVRSRPSQSRFQA